MKTIKINERSLRELLEECYFEAFRFNRHDCRIPVYLEKDGVVTTGDWLLNSIIKHNAIELPIVIQSWDIEGLDVNNDPESMEPVFDEINKNMDGIVSFMMEKLKEINPNVRYVLY